ncbi:hypothetical protein [Piscirickettsia salmonis]|uniref:hypothetical protein n=1 Tax=Piscirickettsia salmonis TaxID=1238 RepID=UPI0018ACF41A|nr:hypothetical protein [Piscirickettsia salmonis]
MPILEYKRPRSGSIIERKLENGNIETYQSVGSLGEGTHGSVRRFESQTGLAKFRKRRYLGRYFAHPMMQNRRAKRDDYKPSAVRVTQRCVP